MNNLKGYHLFSDCGFIYYNNVFRELLMFFPRPNVFMLSKMPYHQIQGEFRYWCLSHLFALFSIFLKFSVSLSTIYYITHCTSLNKHPTSSTTRELRKNIWLIWYHFIWTKKKIKAPRKNIESVLSFRFLRFCYLIVPKSSLYSCIEWNTHFIFLKLLTVKKTSWRSLGISWTRATTAAPSCTSAGTNPAHLLYHGEVNLLSCYWNWFCNKLLNNYNFRDAYPAQSLPNNRTIFNNPL